LIEYLLSNLK